MDYQLQLAAVPVPEADLHVLAFLNKLRQDADDRPPSAMLLRFHEMLAKLFPDAPLSERHYAGDVGRLTPAGRRPEVVPHVLYIAGELGLTVVDNQSGEVHRPPTYQVVLEGPVGGIDPADAGRRLAGLMRQPVAQMQALVSSRRRTVVKKNVPRFQANQYIAALRDRAGCHATLVPEPGPVARPAPHAPQPAPPAAMAARAAPSTSGQPATAPTPALRGTTGSPSQPATAPTPASGGATGLPGQPAAAPTPAARASAGSPGQTAVAPLAAHPGAASLTAGGLSLASGDAPASALRQPAMPPLSRDAAANDAAVAEAGADAKLFLVAEGVRLICIAIGLNFLLRGAIREMAQVPAAVSSCLLLAMTVYGCLRLGAGLGFSVAVRAAIVLLVGAPVVMTFGAAALPIPLPVILASAVASLLLLLLLGLKGTRTLKQAGYKVGLFGASKDDVRHLGGMAEGERLQSTTLAWATFTMVFLAYMTGQVNAPEQPRQLTSGDVPCQFVGTWEVQKNGGVHQFTLADDGSYSASVVSGQAIGSFADYAGNWRYNGSSLYFTDEAFTPVRKWVNNVASVGEEEFHAHEGSGPPLVFKLKQRGKSLRCKY